MRSTLCDPLRHLKDSVSRRSYYKSQVVGAFFVVIGGLEGVSPSVIIKSMASRVYLMNQGLTGTIGDSVCM
jgi:hypothetical protein